MRLALGSFVLLFGAAACRAHSSTQSAAGAYATLRDVNDQVNEARKLLLQRVGANLDAEKASIDTADQRLAKARGQLSPALQAPQPDAYKSVRGNLDDAENWLANTRAAWEAERVLQEAERARPPPNDQQLAAVEAKVKLFEERARVEWKPVGTEQLRRVRALSFSMPASMAPKSTGGGGGAGAAKSGPADGGTGTGGRGGGTADGGTASGPKKAEGLAPRLDGILDAAWANDEDKAAADALTVALHATVVKTARAPLKGDARHADLVVDAKVDQCYLVPFVLSTGDMPKDSWRMQYSTSVQAFSLRSPPATLVLLNESGPRGAEAKRETSQEVYGFCALKSGKVTMSLDAPEAPGSKTTLRHVVLTVPRATFPEELLGYLTIGAQLDKCDADAFASYFLKPLPGTLVYRDNEPVILASVGAERLGVLHMNAAVDAVNFAKFAPGWFEKTGMTAVAQLGKLKFPPLGELGGCPDNDAHGTAFAALSRKLLDCAAKVEKKHARDVAEGEAVQASPGYVKDFEAQCAPLQKKAEKDLRKAYDKIVDEFVEKKPANALSHKWVNWLKGQPKQ